MSRLTHDWTFQGSSRAASRNLFAITVDTPAMAGVSSALHFLERAVLFAAGHSPTQEIHEGGVDIADLTRGQ